MEKRFRAGMFFAECFSPFLAQEDKRLTGR
jgi:hypothetical protein